MIIRNFRELAKNRERMYALEIVDSGIAASDAERAVRDNVTLKGGVLKIKGKGFDLSSFERVFVIGFGKASCRMGKGMEAVLGGRIHGGIIISEEGCGLRRIRLEKGTHPLPSLKNVKATKKLVGLLEEAGEKDLVICLVSGGGSALLCYPTVPLEKYLEIMKRAYVSGVDIKGLNKIRKRYSRVKGGKLAKMTKAKIVSLISSDVPGDDLSVVASGPTAGKRKGVENILILNNETALEAMKSKAEGLGLSPVILTKRLQGKASETGKNILREVQGISEGKKGKYNCFLFAGETTVRVRGSGKGGRNQEACLGALQGLSAMENGVFASVASDGTDGNTGAAGGIVDSGSLPKALEKKIDYKDYLKKNDSFGFLKRINGLVYTGKTGTNIADIGVILKL